MIVLLAANLIIWSQVFKNFRRSINEDPLPWNPRFDEDLDALYDAESPIIERRVFGINEYAEPTGILEFPGAPEDYFEDSIGYPEDIVYADGIPLIPGNIPDIEEFILIRNKAYTTGLYNEKNLDEGGMEDMRRDGFILVHGFSRYGATHLALMGESPWNWSQYDLAKPRGARTQTRKTVRRLLDRMDHTSKYHPWRSH